MKSKLKVISLLMIVLAILFGCSQEGNQASNTSSESKELKIAYDTKPPTIDPHMSTAAATREVSRPIYEGLVALDSNYKPQPMLAESWEISEDGKTITFILRKGIKFHNGKEMLAEDVIASMNRWKEISTAALANFSEATFEAKDNYTVELNLIKPSSTALVILGGPTQPASIMPKDIIESAGDTGVKEYIGTGPYKVVTFVQDQSLTLEKFKDYKPLSTPKDGLAGKKEALVDTLVYEYVTDTSTRLSSVETGQYDIATKLSKDNFDMVEDSPKMDAHIVAGDFGTAIFNKKEGLFSNQKARQAVLAALDMESILIAVESNESFYKLEPSLATVEQVEWHNDAGKELYNQKNIEKAKKLLKESGYDGEEVRLMTSRDLDQIYNASIALQQQLQSIGMNVKLDVYDWAALLVERKNPSIWDIFFTGWPTEPVPSNYVFLHSENQYPGWSNSSVIDKLVDDISSASTQEESSELFIQLQEEFYNYVPAIKYGENKVFNASGKNITGIDAFYGLIPWGIDKQN